MLNKLSNYYHKIIGRLYECAGLYRIDLNAFESKKQSIIDENFEFYMPKAEDLDLFDWHYNHQPFRNHIINSRFESGTYLCFAFRDLKSGRLAYTRWLCVNQFYSDYLKKDLIFKKNEAFTLDSFTHPDYRGLGLHRRMNIEMLQWLKKSTDYRYVYMVIKCFIPHLHKVVKDLGYKKIETKIYYKQGSLKQFFKLVANKFSK